MNWILLKVLLVSALLLSKGPNYPTDYFRSPVDFPIKLSGTFGEPRSNHFHAGLDIKTYKQIGKKVYAVADGYVVRIKVSAYGYGKALYVKHPNGYTSVYAHLSHFSTEIDKFVKVQQYVAKRFRIERYPTASQFPVKKGDIIAFTGNSGGSKAPHLHFELRDSGSEIPINPLLFGINVADNLPPKIYSLMVYPMSSTGKDYEPLQYEVKKLAGIHKIKIDTILLNSNRVAFGLNTDDQLDGADNRNGIYALHASVNNELVFSAEMNRIAFDKMRYLNCHIDYAAKILTRNIFHKFFLDNGNRLSIYENLVDRGVLSLKRGETYSINLLVTDYHGNQSLLAFFVKQDETAELKKLSSSSRHIYYPGRSSSIINKDIHMYFPPKALYDSLRLEYARRDTVIPVFSAIHKVHNSFVPLHTAIELAIKPTNMPPELKSKVMLIRRDSRGNLQALKSHWSGEMLSAKSKALGDFFIKADTTAPKIRPYNIREGKDMAKSSAIQIKISDNLSGIRSYYPTVDNKWILMEYDPKRSMLTYEFDEHVGEGTHRLKLTVYDEVNNISKLELNFTK